MNFAPGIAEPNFTKRCDVGAADLRSKNDDQILLAAQLVPKQVPLLG